MYEIYNFALFRNKIANLSIENIMYMLYMECHLNFRMMSIPRNSWGNYSFDEFWYD